MLLLLWAVLKEMSLLYICCIVEMLISEKKEGLQRKLPAGCHAEDYEPGREWFRRFKKRHLEITLRTPEGLSLARKSVSKTSVKQWFANVREYLSELHDGDDLPTDPSRTLI